MIYAIGRNRNDPSFRVALVIFEDLGGPLHVACRGARRNEPIVSSAVLRLGLCRIKLLKLDLDAILQIEPVVITGTFHN